jgi:hypothetical protein
MQPNDVKKLQSKIMEGLQIASQKLIETKKRNNQEMAISVNGKVQIIKPE